MSPLSEHGAGMTMIQQNIERTKRPASQARGLLRIVSRDDCSFATADSMGTPIKRRTANAAPESWPGIAPAGGVDEMFGVLNTRLRKIAAECPGAASGPTRHLGMRQLKARILECAAALEDVHAALTPDIIRLHRMDGELHKMRADLACAQAELAGARVRENEARCLAMHDGLTALPNRGFFQERLNQALSPSRRPQRSLAVLYIDLDGFKILNDCYGHRTGDELLRIVAARLAHTVRAEDMVSRLGGDEFGCLLMGLPDREQIRLVATKLFDAVSAPFNVGALDISLHPSIGIAVSPDDGMTADALLHSADAAMYHAKRHRSRHAFFAEIH